MYVTRFLQSDGRDARATQSHRHLLTVFEVPQLTAAAGVPCHGRGNRRQPQTLERVNPKEIARDARFPSLAYRVLWARIILLMSPRIISRAFARLAPVALCIAHASLNGVELPEGVHPTLGPQATPIGEVYRYTLDSKTTDPMTLRTLQDWVVRPQFLQVQGVADVVTLGGLIREIHVQPDPTRLALLGVGLSDVFDALSKASANATGGYVQRGSEAFVIRSIGILGSVDDIGLVRVGIHGGVPVTIKDVAKISEGWAPRQGVVTRNQNEDAVEGIVLMRRGQNPSVVLEGLREKIEHVNNRLLPKDVHISPFYDRTDLVHTTLHTVFHNLVEGAVLVCLVLFAFMLSVRASLIVATVIPLSLAASFIYLRMRGMSANLLSMGAVDFGIIVDGAVILVEHLYEKLSPHDASELHKPLGRDELAQRIIHTTREVARPTLFSLLIIIAAYLPIFSLQRVEGRVFAPLAHTVVSALLGALLVSFTLVPALTYFALRKPRVQRISPLLTFAQRVFDPLLAWSLRYVAAVIIAALGMLGAAILLLPRMGSKFLPSLNEGALYVTFTLPDNISMDQARALTPALRERIQKTPEVTEVLSQLGRPEDGTDPKLPNNLEIFIKLKPLEAWRKEMKSPDDITRELVRNLSNVPGIDYNVSQPIRDNVAENISGQQGQIAVTIYGDDLTSLRDAAEKARDVIARVPGAADVAVVKASESPQVVHLNRAASLRLGYRKRPGLYRNQPGRPRSDRALGRSAPLRCDRALATGAPLRPRLYSQHQATAEGRLGHPALRRGRCHARIGARGDYT